MTLAVAGPPEHLPRAVWRRTFYDEHRRRTRGAGWRCSDTTDAMLVRVLLFLAGLALRCPARDLLRRRHDFELDAIGDRTYRAVTGVMLMILGFMTFTFTLLLHTSDIRWQIGALDDGWRSRLLLHRAVPGGDDLDPPAARHRQRRACRHRAAARSATAAGRLFILGVGGSAGHASHAVNDFRKLCGFEAYAPTDNVSELTARINDEGWDSALAEWLKARGCGAATRVLIFSVGGGNREKNISREPGARDRARARTSARRCSASSAATAASRRRSADACVVIPPLVPDGSRRTPRGCARWCGTCSVSHPALKTPATKWESTSGDRRLRAGAALRASYRAVRHRRRRGLHRQPLRRPPAGDAGVRRVTVYDNFSSGQTWHYEAHVARPRASKVVARRRPRLRRARRRRWPATTTVIHLASNPDIARAMTEPDIDFRQGTLLTHNVVEAMRRSRRASDPLRLRHRRLRRPRRRSRRTRTTARSCPSRPTAPASSPARR